MATPVFVPGYNRGITFTPDGGGTTVFNVTGWDSTEKVKELLTTHSGSGGLQAMIAGIFDINGRFKANFDAANNFFTVLHAGGKGTVTFDFGTTNPESVHVMITEVHGASTVDGLVEYDVTAKSDSSPGGTTFTRPS